MSTGLSKSLRGPLRLCLVGLLTMPGSVAWGEAAPVSAHGSRMQHETDIAETQPGPHDGGGFTTGHWFFQDAEGLPFAFKKRVLHPGSAIGLHPHDKDEIYYVLSGRGELTLDGKRHVLGPGDAVLTRIGSEHGLRPLGEDDLTLIIVYPTRVPARSD